jgi:hypothetical protein
MSDGRHTQPVPVDYDTQPGRFQVARDVLRRHVAAADVLVAEHLRAVEVDAWDLPLLTLPDQDAVCDYLIGKGTDATVAAEATSEVDVPLTVTKRGAVVWGRI